MSSTLGTKILRSHSQPFQYQADQRALLPVRRASLALEAKKETHSAQVRLIPVGGCDEKTKATSTRGWWTDPDKLR